MAKRKPTYTKGTSDQNLEMLRRARDLLAGADLDTVAKDHQDIVTKMKAEFPGVTYARIKAQMAKAILQLRYVSLIINPIAAPVTPDEALTN